MPILIGKYIIIIIMTCGRLNVLFIATLSRAFCGVSEGNNCIEPHTIYFVRSLHIYNFNTIDF